MTVHVFLGAGFDSNCFLVTGDRPILVDTGTGAYHRRLVRAIMEASFGKVHSIVLTHRHFDHTGGAAQMAAEMGAEVLMHELDAPAVRSGSSEDTAATMFGRRMEPVEVRGLKGGEVLDTGEHKLQVIHSPGHTEGGLCLFDAERGRLISGDTVFASGVGRWDLPTGNRDALVRSIRALAELRPTELYPGHGPVAMGKAQACIEEALDYLGE